MEATAKQFNDFITNEIIKNLGITEGDYAKLIFEAGIKANENNAQYKSFFTTTGVFWDCFSYHIHFINLKIIVEDIFYKSLNNEENSINNVADYFQLITQKFELPKRTINLIHKQYKLEFDKKQIYKQIDLQPLKKQRRVRVSKKVNNQTEINLNTI